MGEASKKQTSRRILICGAYGADNIGDEAMLKAIIAEIRGIDPEAGICVMTRKPKATSELYQLDAIHTFDFINMRREMKKADIFINGGGSLIQNVTSRRSLYYYLYTLKTAKKCGCKVLMYGCGMGPVNGEKDIRLTADTLNECADAISLRDPDSAKLLEEIGVTKPEVHLAADPVLSLSACGENEVLDFMEKAGIEPEGRYLCLSLRPWSGFSEKSDCIIKAVKFAYDKLGLTPVFLPMNYGVDAETARRVAEAAEIPHVVLPPISDASLAIGLMSRMKLLISMRLHALLFAADSNIPAVAISYDPKVSAFCNYAGSGACIEIPELSAEKLIECIKTECSAGGTEVMREKLLRARKAEAVNAKTLAAFMERGAE